MIISDSMYIRVAVRIRPLQNETRRKCPSTIERIPGQPQLTFQGKIFKFNHVFGANDSQDVLYKDACYEMTDKLFKGFNVCIFAYGQTGSGKTYTMGTKFDGKVNENMGVIPRAMNDIFQIIEKKSNDFDFKVTFSFMEIYKEKLYDLLSSDKSNIDSRKVLDFSKLTELKVKSFKETIDCLMKRSSDRAAATNERSSRSHSIFTLTLQSSSKSEVKNAFSSKFHLVDLAGSEPLKKTSHTEDRLKERGIYQLESVTSDLINKRKFVSYRNSKLTNYLKEIVGGNSFTLMIACVSPDNINFDETSSTLSYADQNRKIKNEPIFNQVQHPHAAEINRPNGIIQSCGVMSSSMEGSSSFEGVKRDTPSMPYSELMEKYCQLKMQYEIALQDVINNKIRAVTAENAHEKLKLKTEEVTKQVIELSETMNEDSCPPEFLDHARKLGGIRKLIEDPGIEFQKSHEEMEDTNEQSEAIREKEVMQLKKKDKKMRNEMARKESLHNKQWNVLKRNYEEALAIKKRLKDALERQKVAQSPQIKDKPNTNASKLEQITSRDDEEITIIVSLIDAKNSVEQLVNDRDIFSSRIKSLNEANNPNNKEELAKLEEDLQLLNAQITDLQQKVVSTDIEARIKSFTETVQTLSEAQTILNHLFTVLIKNQRELESAEEKLELNKKELNQLIPFFQ